MTSIGAQVCLGQPLCFVEFVQFVAKNPGHELHEFRAF